MNRLSCTLIGLAGSVLALLSPASAEPAATAPSPAADASRNLALGKPVTLSAKPNYALTASADDAPALLTDGKHTPTTDWQSRERLSFWTQKSTVGWQHQRAPIHLTVDLQSQQPIGGVALRTSGGSAGVALPGSILISVSDDGESFHEVGDLITLSNGELPPPYGQLQTHRFVTDKLQAVGRYVRFSVAPGMLFFFTDELEVFKGDDAWLANAPALPAMDKDRAADPLRLTQVGVHRRIRADLEAIRREVAEAKTSSRAALLEELATLARELADGSAWPATLEGFRAVLPVNDLHARVLAVRGRLLGDGGGDPLVVWHADRFEMLSHLASPRQSVRELTLKLARRDPRSEMLSLTNQTGRPMRVRVVFEGLPVDHLQAYTVATVDDRTWRPVMGALLPLTLEKGQTELTLPAGFTTPLWLTFDLPESHQAGKAAGRVTIHDLTRDQSQAVALTLDVAPVTLPAQPALSQTLWDYVHDGVYGITPDNQQPAQQRMEQWGIDAPWAAPGSQPRISRSNFDAQGNLTGKIDYSRFDAFVDRFPDARHYMVFGNITGGFAGFAQASPAYDNALSQWAADWERHLKARGIDPTRVLYCPYDEPGNDKAWQNAMNSAKAFRQGTSAVGLFITTHPRFVQSEVGKQAMSYYDVLCPTLAHLDVINAQGKAYFAELQQAGKRVWIYMCSSGMEADPSYFRLQPWYVWMVNGQGSGFWSLGDNGVRRDEHPASSWNQYAAFGSHAYSPLFLGKADATLSRHWMAMVEGVRDHEYLVLLKERVEALEAANVRTPALRQARQMLDTLPQQTFRDTQKRFGVHYASTWNHSCEVAEASRLKVLAMLTRLAD